MESDVTPGAEDDPTELFVPQAPTAAGGSCVRVRFLDTSGAYVAASRASSVLLQELDDAGNVVAWSQLAAGTA